MLPRNTTIPTKKTEIFSTSLDHQTSVEIRVVQGEHARASDNRTLAYLTLSGLEPRMATEAQIEITFDVDANGVLNVEARDRLSGTRQYVTIVPQAGLTRADIRRLTETLQSARRA